MNRNNGIKKGMGNLLTFRDCQQIFAHVDWGGVGLWGFWGAGTGLGLFKGGWGFHVRGGVNPVLALSRLSPCNASTFRAQSSPKFLFFFRFQVQVASRRSPSSRRGINEF